MTIHFDPIFAERNAAASRFSQAKHNLRRQDDGLRWGAAPAVRQAADAKVLNAPVFDIANAPAGARIVPFSQLEDGQCQWGFNHGERNLFCGLPVDPRAKGTTLFRRYCPHHAKTAKGRTVTR